MTSPSCCCRTTSTAAKSNSTAVPAVAASLASAGDNQNSKVASALNVEAATSQAVNVVPGPTSATIHLSTPTMIELAP